MRRGLGFGSWCSNHCQRPAEQGRLAGAHQPPARARVRTAFMTSSSPSRSASGCVKAFRHSIAAASRGPMRTVLAGFAASASSREPPRRRSSPPLKPRWWLVPPLLRAAASDARRPLASATSSASSSAARKQQRGSRIGPAMSSSERGRDLAQTTNNAEQWWHQPPPRCHPRLVQAGTAQLAVHKRAAC
jgi:hypothetical protein